MYKIKLNSEDPYASLIEGFISKDFPRRLAPGSANLLDILTDEIMGTKQTRYGPKPSPESTVASRSVIRSYVDRGLPLPFTSPWGSEKPDGSSVDIAELAALKTLACLNARIVPHYEPGIRVNLRIEDASAPYLLFDDTALARDNAQRYTRDLVSLVAVLNLNFVKPKPESDVVTEEQFNNVADEVLTPIDRALKIYDNGYDDLALETLNAIGWQGGIPAETREHYYSSYQKLYPNQTHDAHKHILARYFASALARRRLKIRGDEPEWNGEFIDLSFMPAVPGTSTLFGRRVYYRTLPLEFTSNHIAPWRAKGYLSIGNDNTVTPKLASWQDRKPYNASSVVLSDDVRTVSVKADYILT